MNRNYGAASPTETHRREATCKEVDCKNWNRGWDTTVPAGGKEDAYIRNHLTPPRSFQEMIPDDKPGWVTFRFYPGQTCFVAHTTPLWRTPFFTVSDGMGMSRLEPTNWVDDFSEHLERLKKETEIG